jgi:hypothetical protein
MVSSSNAAIVTSARAAAVRSLGTAQQAAARIQQTLQGMAAPPTKVGARATTKASFALLPVGYVLPANASDQDNDDWMFFLAACARSATETDMTKWSNWLVSLILFLYRDVLAPEVGKEYNRIEITPQFLMKIKVFRDDINIEAPVSVGDYTPIIVQARNKLGVIPFPLPGTLDPTCVGQKLMVATFYGYLGCVMFAMHKDAGGSGENALRRARNESLLGKYKWTEQTAPLLSSRLGPSVHAFIQIANAWKYIPGVRISLFKYCCKIPETGGGLTDEVMFTVVRLMRWTDLAHISIITDAINTFDYIAEIPSLSGSLIAYHQGVLQLLNSCDDVYDETGRVMLTTDGRPIKDMSYLPYMKVFKSDVASLAERKNMLPLLYVSYKALLPIRPTLSNYAVPDEFPREWNDFELFRTTYDAVLAAGADDEATQNGE